MFALNSEKEKLSNNLETRTAIYSYMPKIFPFHSIYTFHLALDSIVELSDSQMHVKSIARLSLLV